MADKESGPQFALTREIGATESIAIVTLAAAAAAGLYNIGAFAPIGVGFVSLLTLDDIFIGAANSAVLIVMSALMMSLILMILDSTSHSFRKIAAIFIAIFLVGIFVYSFTTGHPLRYALILLVFMAGFLTLLVRRWRRFRRAHLLVMGASFLAIGAFLTGVSVSQAALENIEQSNDTVITLKDDQVVSGKLFKTTSSYLFLVQGKDLQVVSLSEVRHFSRQELF